MSDSLPKPTFNDDTPMDWHDNDSLPSTIDKNSADQDCDSLSTPSDESLGSMFEQELARKSQSTLLVDHTFGIKNCTPQQYKKVKVNI